MEMSCIKVPIIAIVVGEGSSGGALALSVADRIVMLENSIYSVLSPEGYASILWKDASRAKEAAEKMKLTAQDLQKDHIIDGIIVEPEEGVNHENIMQVIPDMRNYIVENIQQLEKQNIKQLLENRYQKYKLNKFCNLWKSVCWGFDWIFGLFLFHLLYNKRLYK